MTAVLQLVGAIAAASVVALMLGMTALVVAVVGAKTSRPEPKTEKKMVQTDESGRITMH